MMEELEKMRRRLQECENLTKTLRRNEDRAWEKCSKFMPEIMDYMGKLLALAEEPELCLEIPVEILMQQLRNFEDAYQQKDIVLLADTMEYELRESMLFYIDILENLERIEDVQ